MHMRPWLAAGLVLALASCTDKAGDSGGDVNLYVSYAGCYLSGGAVECDIAVDNLGADASGSFKVGVFVNHGGDPSPGDSADGQATINNVAGGGTGSATISVAAGSGDSLWVLVDMTDVVAETDESDNVQGPQSPTQRR